MEQATTALVPVSPPASYPKYIRLDQLAPRIPVDEAKKRWFFSEEAARIHMAVLGASGSGKSRLLGRLLAAHLVLKRKPLVLIDPIGGTVNQLFDRIARLPRAWQRQFWPRITYIDVGATDYLVPQPLYYRLSPGDTLFEMANRFPAIIKRQDKDLQSAPILGWNSLYECAIYAGMIAAALGPERQLDFVADLVQHPGHYKEELKQALARDPMLQSAVTYFRELMDPGRSALHERRTGSLMTKLIPFLSDPLALANYSGSGKGIDWERVAHEGETVIIDLRNVRDPDLRQFAMLWHFKAFTDFVKHRGIAGREQPITFIIDELADMVSQQDSKGRSLLAEDLEELVARLGRNMGVTAVLSAQTLSALEPGIQNVLLQLGTLVAGRMANQEDALTLAENLLIYDPYRVKKVERVWFGESIPLGYGQHMTVPQVIDYRTHEFTLDEQRVMLGDKLKQLQRYDFLVRAATAEGKINHTIRQLTIANHFKDQHPDENYMAYLRSLLRQARGVPVQELLDEINKRRPTGQLEQKPVKKPVSKAKDKALAINDTITKGEPPVHDTTRDPLSRTTVTAGAAQPGTTPKQAAQSDEEDDIFS